MRCTTFTVSDKVVCVAVPRVKSHFRPPLVVGRVYVVREVCTADDDTPALRLVGVRGKQSSGAECVHDPIRYRLLSELQGRKGKPEIFPLPPQEETRSIPVLGVPQLSDDHWLQVCKMQADAVGLIKAGKDGEAFSVLCSVLRHDCPIRWLLACRMLATESRTAGRRSQTKKRD